MELRPLELAIERPLEVMGETPFQLHGNGRRRAASILSTPTVLSPVTLTCRSLIGPCHGETPSEHIFADAKPFKGLPFGKLSPGDGQSHVVGYEQHAANPGSFRFIRVIPIAAARQSIQCRSRFMKKKTMCQFMSQVAVLAFRRV